MNELAIEPESTAPAGENRLIHELISTCTNRVI